MNILESTQYIITIPTESDALATLLDDHAGDWPEVLAFLVSVARSQGVIIKGMEIAKMMRKMYDQQ